MVLCSISMLVVTLATHHPWVTDVLDKETWVLGWQEKNKEVLAYTQAPLQGLCPEVHWQVTEKNPCSLRASLAIAPVGLLFLCKVVSHHVSKPSGYCSLNIRFPHFLSQFYFKLHIQYILLYLAKGDIVLEQVFHLCEVYKQDLCEQCKCLK